MIAQEECVRGMKMQEKEVGEDTALSRKGFVTGLHCCLLKVTEMNWTRLNAVASSLLHTHTGFSF